MIMQDQVTAKERLAPLDKSKIKVIGCCRWSMVGKYAEIGGYQSFKPKKLTLLGKFIQFMCSKQLEDMK